LILPPQIRAVAGVVGVQQLLSTYNTRFKI